MTPQWQGLFDAPGNTDHAAPRAKHPTTTQVSEGQPWRRMNEWMYVVCKSFIVMDAVDVKYSRSAHPQVRD